MMSSSLSLLRAGALTTGSLEAEAVSPPSSFSAAAAAGLARRAAGGVELVGIGADLALDVVGDLRVVLQELLGVVTALPQAHVTVVEPCAALLDDAQLDTHVDQLAHLGDALTEHDVKSASRNGGATLFLTILARVWLPMNWPEESFRPSTRRMSMRTEE